MWKWYPGLKLDGMGWVLTPRRRDNQARYVAMNSFAGAPPLHLWLHLEAGCLSQGALAEVEGEEVFCA